MSHRDHAEHQRQRGKDECLDETHEDLKAVEGQGEDLRNKEGEHQDHHFSGEHVAEKTEGEAD